MWICGRGLHDRYQTRSFQPTTKRYSLLSNPPKKVYSASGKNLRQLDKNFLPQEVSQTVEGLVDSQPLQYINVCGFKGNTVEY